MTTDPRKKISIRIRVIELLFGSVILMLAARAVHLQILDADILSSRAEKEQLRPVTLMGRRGDILDRHLKALSTSLDAVSVAVDPKRIKHPDQAARLLAPILKTPEKPLLDRLTTGDRFVWLKRQLPPKTAERIRKLGIEGVTLHNDTMRFHPSRQLAAQVIGITGRDGRGLEGLENRFDDLLSGDTRKVMVEKSALGSIRNIPDHSDGDIAGRHLVLTLDKTIQAICERALASAVTAHEGHSGMAVVMTPATGEILAMAHYPLFNPNDYQQYPPSLWRNRAVADTFEPGSTLKIFLAAAALESGISSPETLFYCENGRFSLKGETIRDTHPHGWLTLNRIIQLSSNIGVSKVGLRLGPARLHKTLKQFGFGRKTGIPFPIETRGRLMPPSRWTPVDTAAISFGQGISVSAVQLAAAVSTIANRGVFVKPMLVRSILDPDRTPREAFTPAKGERVISEATARAVNHMMQLVVTEEGTGTLARPDGYSVCGKTGTAQKMDPDNGGYSQTRYTALFVGFSPADDPRLTVVVAVDEPQTSHYGGVVAAPAFRTILQDTFNYLHIPPDFSGGTGA